MDDQVVNARSALLSNFEVLTLLRELEGDHLVQAKTAIRIKKEDEDAGRPASNYTSAEQVCENLRTVEVEVFYLHLSFVSPAPLNVFIQAIQYLTAEYQPISSQSEDGISKMLKGLESYSLTKAEKLQIVNLAPTEPVEIYVVSESHFRSWTTTTTCLNLYRL
jgi:hypothetical protein